MRLWAVSVCSCLLYLMVCSWAVGSHGARAHKDFQDGGGNLHMLIEDRPDLGEGVLTFELHENARDRQKAEPLWTMQATIEGDDLIITDVPLMDVKIYATFLKEALDEAGRRNLKEVVLKALRGPPSMNSTVAALGFMPSAVEQKVLWGLAKSGGVVWRAPVDPAARAEIKRREPPSKGYQAVVVGAPPEEHRYAILKALPRESAQEIQKLRNIGKDPVTVLCFDEKGELVGALVGMKRGGDISIQGGFGSEHITSVMLSELKHEVDKGAVNRVSVIWPECTLEAMRAAVATGFISQGWLGPGTSKFGYHRGTEKEDESYETMDVHVFRDGGASVGATGSLLMASGFIVWVFPEFSIKTFDDDDSKGKPALVQRTLHVSLLLPSLTAVSVVAALAVVALVGILLGRRRRRKQQTAVLNVEQVVAAAQAEEAKETEEAAENAAATLDGLTGEAWTGAGGFYAETLGVNEDAETLTEAMDNQSAAGLL